MNTPHGGWRPLADSTVAIVGVGLLGGSLALALRSVCARVVGVVEPGDEATARKLHDNDIVDDVLTLEAAAAQADIVVLATPVRTTIQLVATLAPLVRSGALVIDVGSTKVAIVDAMTESAATSDMSVDWIGGHPMAGGVTAGLSEIDARLFDAATWALCSASTNADRAVARSSELATSVGAVPLTMTAADHDRAVALVSHTPYVVAQALRQLGRARLIAPTDDPPLAAAGWERATRAANGDPTMWMDILATNGPNVAQSLRQLATELNRVADTIDHDGVTALNSNPLALRAVLAFCTSLALPSAPR